MPRDSAVSAYLNIQSGVRWAETTRDSKEMLKSRRISTAGCKCSKSLLLPMMRPTSTDFFEADVARFAFFISLRYAALRVGLLRPTRVSELTILSTDCLT